MFRFFIIYMLFSCCVNAQNANAIYTLKNWDTAYCYYYELGKKIQNLYFAYDKQHPEEDKFNDLMYKSPAGDRLIYITAKLLSSSKLKAITRYYNIEFEGCDTSFNISYHPYTIEYLNESILKHKIIKDNSLDKYAVCGLIAEWQKKSNIVTDDELAAGSSCNYNTSPYSIDIYADSSVVQIRGNEIYIENKLFAHYSSNKMTYATYHASKEDLFFYFTSLNGTRFAEVRLVALYPYITITSPYLQEPLRAYIPVREETRLVRVCTKILLAYLNDR